MTEPLARLADAAADPLLRSAWLVPALPFFGFLLNGLVIRPLRRSLCGPLATLLVFASAVLAWAVTLRYFSLFPAGSSHPALVSWQLPWLKAMPGLEFAIGT